MLPGRMDGGWDGRTIMWGPGGAAGASWGSSSTMAACAALADIAPHSPDPSLVGTFALAEDGATLVVLSGEMAAGEELFLWRGNWTDAEALARLGVTPEQIEFIAVTHLHWDHIGGASRFLPGGGPTICAACQPAS